MFEDKKVLTGVKPTGTPHLGNYLGAIKPAIRLGHQALDAGGKHYMFIADYHAINAEKDPAVLNQKLKEIACIYLAAGLDPSRSVFYRQSDIAEIPEITTILYAYTPKGFMNKAHAYKAAVDRNREAGKPDDDGVWGGGEQYVLDLCRALESDGHSVAVVTRGYKDVDRHFAEAGFSPGKLPLKGRLDFISPIVLARVLNRMEAPIVVHAHNFKDADTAVRARRLMADPSKVRIVVTRHLAKAGRTGRYAEDLYAGIDALIFVSETARKEFLSTSPVIRPSKMHVIYNAITLAPKHVVSCGSDGGGSVTLLYAGRISPEKGLEVLIRAMEKLQDNIRLLVAGQRRSRDVK